MIRVQLYIVLLVSLSFNGLGKIAPHPTYTHSIPDHNIIRGDSARAKNSKHHDYTGNELIAQLGYIDTFVTTDQEFRDNLEIGLRVLPGSDYEVVSFLVSFQSCNYMGPYQGIGNKISSYFLKYLGAASHRFKSGDKFFF